MSYQEVNTQAKDIKLSVEIIPKEAYSQLYEWKKAKLTVLMESAAKNYIRVGEDAYSEMDWLVQFYNKHQTSDVPANQEDVNQLLEYAKHGYHHIPFDKVYLPAHPELKRFIHGDIVTDAEVSAAQAKSTIYKDMPALPPGFHSDFMKYGTGQKYSYPPYFFGASLALVAAVVGNRAVMYSTGGKIHPNVNICSYGPTTISGKSQANGLMVDEFFDKITGEFTNRMDDPQSAAAFKQALTDNTTSLWWIDEVGELLTKLKTGNGGAHGIVDVVCTAYDGRDIPYSRSSKDLSKKNDQVINRSNYTVIPLWSCTTGDLEDNLTWAMATKGLLSRFLWVGCMGTNKTRKNRPRTEKDDEDAAALLNQILWLKAKMDLIPPAAGSDGHPVPDQIRFEPNDIIEDWGFEKHSIYEDPEKEIERIATARCAPNAYKIAMSLSMFDVAKQITKETQFPMRVKLSDDVCTYVTKLMDEFFIPRAIWAVTTAREQDDGKNAILKIKKQLDKRNGIANRSVILNATHLSRKQFDEAIETMVEGCSLKILPGEATGGRIPQVLKLIST